MISTAFAQAAGQEQDPTTFIFFMVALIAIFYLVAIRPQMKRNKEHKKLIESITMGDEVIIQGGIAGKVVDLGESFIKLEVSENVAIKVQKASVIVHLPKGTLGSL